MEPVNKLMRVGRKSLKYCPDCGVLIGGNKLRCAPCSEGHRMQLAKDRKEEIRNTIDKEAKRARAEQEIKARTASWTKSRNEAGTITWVTRNRYETYKVEATVRQAPRDTVCIWSVEIDRKEHSFLETSTCESIKAAKAACTRSIKRIIQWLQKDRGEGFDLLEGEPDERAKSSADDSGQPILPGLRECCAQTVLHRIELRTADPICPLQHDEECGPVAACV